MASRRVDARDVLDPDGKTRCRFRGRVLGRYRRSGPNAWDDYVFHSESGGEIEVLPGLKVQLERFGARLRMRRGGEVLRVEWIPPEELSGASSKALREAFLERCVATFDEDPGRGAAAVIATKLRG